MKREAGGGDYWVEESSSVEIIAACAIYNGFFAGKPGLRGYWGGVAATLSTTTR